MRNSHAQYLAVFVLSTVALLTLLGGFNLLVDPYEIFKAPVVPGFNDSKNGRGHITEPYKMYSEPFDTLVVGSSRVQGIFCEDIGDGFNTDGWGCKVASMPHANASWLIKTVYHASFIRNVKRVYFGLDFFGFNMSSSPLKFTDEERLLGVPGKSNLTAVNDIFRQLFSPVSTQLSVETIRGSVHNDRQTAVSVMDKTLSFPSQAKASPNEEQIEKQKYVAETLDNSPFFKVYPGILDYYRNYSYRIPGAKKNVMDELQSLLKYCRDNTIEVYFFINPFHSIMLDIFREWGLLGRFLSWESELADIIEQANEGLSAPLFFLWDFSGYNDVTTEPVMEGHVLRRGMRFYNDPFHYTRDAGKLVMETMLSGRTVIDGFGVMLTPSAAAMKAQALEEGRQRYGARNAEYRRLLFSRVPGRVSATN